MALCFSQMTIPMLFVFGHRSLHLVLWQFILVWPTLRRPISTAWWAWWTEDHKLGSPFLIIMPQILLSPMSISRSVCSMLAISLIPQSPTTMVKSLHVPMSYEALVYKLVHMMFRTSSSPLVNGQHMGHPSSCIQDLFQYSTGPHMTIG